MLKTILQTSQLPRTRQILRLTRGYSKKIQINSLLDILVETIKTTGPLSLSAYMKTCLTHPQYGYYTTKDPLGVSTRGDFVTSPEISQMFGEMVGVWFYTVYLTQNRPQALRFIEFGPGRGTLMFDTLKAFNKLSKTTRPEILLVEASDALKREQHKLLCGPQNPYVESEDGIGQKSTTIWGNPIRWVDTEEDIEEIGHLELCNYVVCHEFFDALPIKQFEKTEKGWRECLVDYVLPQDQSTKDNEGKLSLPSQTVIKTSDLETPKDVKFHVTIAPKKTTAAYLPQNSPRHNALPVGSRVEISPETLTYSKKIRDIITSNQKKQGAALFVDYGPAETIPINTFRGIRDHKIVSPFEKPGSVDLSADVDFGAIKELMLNLGGVAVHGPVEQGDWLNELGMGYRAQMLMETVKTEEERDKIKKSYLRLVEKGGSGMGKIYKFMGIVPEDGKKLVGFGGDLE